MKHYNNKYLKFQFIINNQSGQLEKAKKTIWSKKKNLNNLKNFREPSALYWVMTSIFLKVPKFLNKFFFSKLKKKANKKKRKREEKKRKIFFL